MTEQTAAIEVRSVTKRFGSVTAVNDVSFSVKPGELFFLLGPSGCGKTTLLRILAGLEELDSGSVFFSGRNVSDLPPHKRGAPMVFQNYALWPHLTVSENIAFGLVERGVPKREAKARVAATLERVDLAGFGARLPGQLSGGQQQRVVLARALVLDPAVMLLDEPLSNLDAKLRSEMRDEIEKLHRETAITFVYVTHDQVEALSLADRIAVMRDGRICAEGAPRGLYHRPPNLFCANFLGESNILAAKVLGSESGYALIETALGNWRAVAAGKKEPATGSAVKCMVRPENLREGEVTGANCFEAEVKRVRLNGATLSAGLLAWGIELHAALLSDQAVDLKPGIRRHWHVDPCNTVIIPEE